MVSLAKIATPVYVALVLVTLVQSAAIKEPLHEATNVETPTPIPDPSPTLDRVRTIEPIPP